MVIANLNSCIDLNTLIQARLQFVLLSKECCYDFKVRKCASEAHETTGAFLGEYHGLT